MRPILTISLGLTFALGFAGCAVVPIDDGYYAPPPVTVVAPVPRYYAAPPPRYYVVPGRPYRHYYHDDGNRRW
ncbi:MAG: hypothetical protein QM739_05785 [Propionivibrio sp.]